MNHDETLGERLQSESAEHVAAQLPPELGRHLKDRSFEHLSLPSLRPAETLLQIAHPISGATTDYDPLLRLVGDAHVVLLGEATHGTHEFYRERA